ncbi:hypothetical protein D9611_006828 [Ephemerocybe angulata]|uniref:Phosphatidylinositol N-acetylglucosaminyltransferase subunit C n=1 Tax=Ephemerocybe angulata TaxID=980116 RepID=A0A8H5B0C0_9AGAR|nr:hypothetical protein D9611_006828 [Tulosesus angulatus]
MESATLTEEWKRVLWKSQPYPDNYVPPEVFLASLQRNALLSNPTGAPDYLEPCTITQHVSVILVFLGTFVRLNEHLLDPRTLIWACIASFLVCYAMWILLDRGKRHPNAQKSGDSNSKNHLKTLKSSIMVFLTLVSLSPVLRTLTAATSSDSIWALSAVLFLLNTLLADYTATNNAQHGEQKPKPTDRSSVAITAGGGSNISAFYPPTTPIVRRRTGADTLAFLQGLSTGLWLFITAALCGFAVYLLAPLSTTVTAICAVVLFSITFVAPMLLVWAQKYKNNIRGPWDVAVPKVR